jgi:hypothetical protein
MKHQTPNNRIDFSIGIPAALENICASWRSHTLAQVQPPQKKKSEKKFLPCTKCSKGCPHGSPLLHFNHSTFQRHVTFIPFFLKPCLKVTNIYLPAAYRKHPIRDFGAPRFILYVYGFDLSGRIWLVSIVMVLVVASLVGCVFSKILAGSPYITFCLYHLPKRHMMCAHF